MNDSSLPAGPRAAVSMTAPVFLIIVIALLVAGALAGAGGALFWAARNPPPAAAVAAPAPAAGPVADSAGGDAARPAAEILPDASPLAVLSDTADYAIRGNPDAPVKVVIFSDPRCPYCRQLATQTEPKILETYGDRVALVYRHFAVLGPDSETAAAALDCAGQIGGRDAFWSYHARLYADTPPADYTPATLAALAADSGLDRQAFAACLDQPSEQVGRDFDRAQALRVTGTPTSFVNGRRVSGAVPFDYFQAAIDEALSAAARP